MWLLARLSHQDTFGYGLKHLVQHSFFVAFLRLPCFFFAVLAFSAFSEFLAFAFSIAL
jgi:hypothetical protein